MLEKLREEISKDLDFSSVYAPVGLNIGGDTPKEIALSILAEIQSIRYKKESTGHLTKDWR
jgi:xanthine dehydrogenase accessory factor